MKTVNFFSFLIFAFCIAICQSASAVTPINHQGAKNKKLKLENSINNSSTAPSTKMALKIGKKKAKWEKRMNKIKNKIKAMVPAIDFSDPTRKWLWYGVLAIAISLALAILAGIIGSSGLFNSLAGLAGLVGLVCLVVWAIKEFG